MANSTAKALADDILNWFKGTAFPASLANTYIALLTTVPTKNDGTGLVEVSGSSYARQVFNSGAWSTISQSADNLHDQITNANNITWPAVTTSSYTVVGIAGYDALTSGNLLWYVAVTSQAVSVGNQYQLLAGVLALEF